MARRKSAVAASKKPIKVVEDDDTFDKGVNDSADDSDFDDAVEPSTSRKASKPQAKRRKGNKTGKGKTAKGKAGALAAVQACPTDILCDVFSQVTLKDLLALSRSSQFIRNLVHHPSQQQLWLDAIKAENLPDVPPGLDVYRYACLMLDRDCQLCGQINSGTHDFALMLRICTRCRKEHYVHDSTPKMSALATDIKACLRSTHNGPVAGGRWRVRRQWWLLKDVEVLLEAMPDDDDINDKANRSAQIANRLKNWQRQEVREKKDEKRDVKQERIDSVKKRLLEAGHDAEDIEPLLSNSMVAKSDALTEAKIRNLLPKLEPLLAEHKEARLALEAQRRHMPRRQAIADRWRARFKADDEPLPPLGDVFEWPSIRELIYGGHGQHADMEDEATQTKEGEDEVVLTDEAIDAALDEFEQMVPEWRQMTIGSLVKLAKGEDEDDIEFASFTCNRCEAAITWPTIVSHVCLRVVWHEETFRKSTTTMIGFLPSILGDRYSSVELAAPFDVDRIKHDAEQSKRLQTLVDNFADASLFENEEPTHDSLMALGYRFKPAGSPSYTMYPDTQLWSWEQIISSRNNKKGGAYIQLPPAFNIVDDDDLREMRRIAITKEIRESEAVWICSLCTQHINGHERHHHPWQCVQTRNATAATQIPPSKPATAALYLDETLRDSTLAARIANGDLDRPTRNERYKKDDRYYGTYMMQQRADTAPW